MMNDACRSRGFSREDLVASFAGCALVLACASTVRNQGGEDGVAGAAGAAGAPSTSGGGSLAAAGSGGTRGALNDECSKDEYLDSTGSCMALTDCAPGEYVSSPESSRSDRECSTCPAKTYSTTRNATRCSSWTECQNGEEESVAPSATRGRVCSVCGAGKFQQAGACMDLTQCQSAEFESTPPTSDSDRVCAAVSDCESGEFVSAEPTATSDRQCDECTSGTFSNMSNADDCLEWGVCGWASVASPGSTQSDVVCEEGE